MMVHRSPMAARACRALVARLDVAQVYGVLCVTLPRGPALEARLRAAGVALDAAGLAVAAHPGRRAIIVAARVVTA